MMKIPDKQLFEATYPDPATAAIIACLELSADLDETMLRDALQNVTNRHGIPVLEPAQSRHLHFDVKQYDIQTNDEIDPALATYSQHEAQQQRGTARYTLLRFSQKPGASTAYLVLNLPAAVVDLASIQQLGTELRMYLNGKNPSTDVISYAAFLDWQAGLDTVDAQAINQRFWRQLASAFNEDAGSRLPYEEHGRLTGKAGICAHQEHSIPTLPAALDRWSRQDDSSTQAVLMSAWLVLLARLTGQARVMSGFHHDGRAYEELSSSIGRFEKTLPVLLDVDGAASFRDCMVSVMAILDEMDDSHEYLQPAAEFSRFSTAFGLISAHAPAVQVATLPLHDTCLSVRYETQTGQFHYYYDTGILSASQVHNWHAHFATLLTALLEQHMVDAPVRALPVLAARDYQKTIIEWNNTDTDYSPVRNIFLMIADRANRMPDAVALHCSDGQTITYQDLMHHAKQLAGGLYREGVRAGDFVALCFERSPEMIISLLGILQAGAAYVPLDPSYPQERLAYMLADADVRILLTDAEQANRLQVPASVRVLEITDMLAQPAPEIALTLPDASYPMYMLYTSGSTGKPKGVVNTHRGLYNRLVWMQEEYHLTSADRVLLKTSYGFDVSVWEIFLPLMQGASLVAVPSGHEANIPYLLNRIQEQAVTVLHFVPSVLSLFLQEADATVCTSLRLVICSGEKLTAYHRQRFFQLLPHTDLHNLYGPTEAAIDVSFYPCQPDDDPTTAPPIGKPISNIQLYILDDNLQPVPIGMKGELYIGGVGVAQGYHRRPRLTAERFIPNPFGRSAGERLYHTGDHAFWNDDGQICYIGRRDHQVKLRGMRIEVEEIEAHLRDHPAINDAVVMIHGQDTEARLVAYVVPDKDTAYPVWYLSQISAELRERELNVYTGQNNIMSVVLSSSWQELDSILSNEQICQLKAIVLQRWEKSKTNLVNNLVRHGLALPDDATIVEIGTFTGRLALELGIDYPRRRIYTWEAVPGIAEIAKHNLNMYRLSATLFNQAVSDVTTTLTLYNYHYLPRYTSSESVAVTRQAIQQIIDLLAADVELIPGQYQQLEAVLLRHDQITVDTIRLSDIFTQTQLQTIDMLIIDFKMEQLIASLSEDDWAKVMQITGHVSRENCDDVIALLQEKGFTATCHTNENNSQTVFGSRTSYHASHAGPRRHYPDYYYNQRAFIADIQQTLQQQLPVTFIPNLFLTVHELPLLPNGKLNRRALLNMVQQATHARPVQEPQTDLEALILRVWQQALKRPRLSTDDNFFEMGGHSFIATAIIAELNSSLNRDIPLGLLFEHPTVASLAQAIQRRNPASTGRIRPRARSAYRASASDLTLDE